MFGIAALVGGAVAGYAVERALLRRSRPSLPTPDAPFGGLEGEVHDVTGPGGASVLAEVYGPSGAPQVVLTHGWLMNRRVWHEQVADLAGDHRLITFDLPGHGRSAVPASRHYDLDLLGDALVAVIEQVAEPGPLVLAGHSLGGMAVLNAVRRHEDVLADRVVGVALLATMSRARASRNGREVGFRGADRLERLARRVTPALRRPLALGLAARLVPGATDLSYLITRSVGVGDTAPPRVVEFVEQLAIAAGPDVFFGLTEAVLGADEDLALSCLTVPTVMMVGEEDRITPPSLSRWMALRCPQAELIVLPGVGHATPLEAPVEVNAVIRRLVANGRSAKRGRRDRRVSGGGGGGGRGRAGSGSGEVA